MNRIDRMAQAGLLLLSTWFILLSCLK